MTPRTYAYLTARNKQRVTAKGLIRTLDAIHDVFGEDHPVMVSRLDGEMCYTVQGRVDDDKAWVKLVNVYERVADKRGNPHITLGTIPRGLETI